MTYIRVLGTGGEIKQDGLSAARFGADESRPGAWARWSWRNSTLIVEVDRYGFYPIFYSELHDGIAVSDSILELLRLGARDDLDDAAIAAFLRFGFFLGEDTPFAAVRAFPPGGRLTRDVLGELAISGARISRSPDGSLSREEAVSVYVDRFRASVVSSLPRDLSRVALPLSGGRDSRHIAIELARLSAQPGMIISQRHFLSRVDDDADVATLLCQALNWPLTVESQVPSAYLSEIQTKGLFDCLTDEHSWFFPSAKRIMRFGATMAFDGIAGDSLSNSIFMRTNWRKLNRETLFQAIVGRLGADENFLRRALARRLRKRWGVEKAEQRFFEELQKIPDDDNLPDRFMFWNRTRREIAPFMIRFLPGVEIVMPYLEEGVFDFLWNLPTNFLEGGCFHDEAIKKAGPDYAAIPFATGMGSVDHVGHAASLMRDMAKDLRNWGGGSLLRRSWLLPRMALTFLSDRASRGGRWYMPWPIWLLGLERLLSEGGRRQ